MHGRSHVCLSLSVSVCVCVCACACALLALVLLTGLSDVDELMVALGCRFALDIFSIAQQDQLHPEPDPLAHDPGYAFWFSAATLVGLTAFSTGGRASMSFLSMVLVGPFSPTLRALP